jgi:ribosome biogenesis GTPase
VSLESLGWSPTRRAAFDALFPPPLLPGRVVRQDRTWLRVRLEGPEILARPTGAMSRHALDPTDLPAVGDWVAVDVRPGARAGLIRGVLPRSSAFVRRAAGDALGGQVMAANVELVLVVAAASAPLHPRRLERTLAAAWSSGAEPVLVLSKADACEDLPGAVDLALRSAGAAQVISTSAVAGDGLDQLTALLAGGRTAVMVGPSGVGKSTLAARLTGRPLATRPVRDWDGKGRHATTHRELLALPSGGALIDGPGVRELGLWEESEGGVDAAFEEVGALAEGCRFRDCRHETEPGCAVRAAVESGALDAGRLESYRKLRRELEHQQARADPRLAAERRQRERALATLAWRRTREKRGG